MQSNSEEYTDCSLTCYQFLVLRETPKCYIISMQGWGGKGERRCLKSADGKGYAHDSKLKALHAFRRRNRIRLSFLRADIIICEHGRAESDQELLNLKSYEK